MLFVVAAGAGAAGFVQGLSGFGFSLVAVAFWAWVMAPDVMGPLVVACALLGQLLGVGTIRRSFEMRRALPFIVGGLLGVPLGAALLPHVEQTVFKTAVGAFLVLWCTALLLARELPRIVRGGRLADATAGWLGGVMGGLGGLTGPAPTLWCTLRGWDKDAQRAVFQSFNLTMLAATLMVYAAGGLLTIDTLRLFAIAAPTMLVPTLLGARLYRRIGDIGFRRVVLVLLLASGVVLLVNTLPRLF